MDRKKITELKFDDKNFNKGNPFGDALLEKSISKFGFREAATLDKNGVLIGGNKRTEKAGSLGFEDVEVIKADPKKVYALQYDDIDIETKEGRELALALNQTAVKNIVIDAELVDAELGEVVIQEWGVSYGKGKYHETFNKDETHAAVIKREFPITVLADEHELTMFDAIKEKLKTKSDYKTFSIILKEYYDNLI